ncbi:MAG: radical SAM protein [Candidatus Nanoarchaeia archaeon]|nr:radical SAM protein [Candidatus Nanoarchaeia archaeon]
MKILLLTAMANTHYVVPPTSLGYLASAVRNSGNEVIIIDGTKEKLTPGKLSNSLNKINPDLVGITVFSCDINVVKNYINVIKKFNNNIHVILGGPHVSGVETEIFENFPGIDYAITGEAEKGFPMLLNQISKKTKNFKDIPGLIWKENSKINHNPSYFECDLDKLDFPAWDLIDPRTYPKAPQGAVFRNYPIAPMIMSRGCPFQCTYCASKVVTGQKFRKRSVDNIMKEVELLYNKFKIKEIHIVDDTFTLDRQRVIDFCNELIKRKIRITYTFPNGVRLDTLDEELLRLLKKTGCYAMSVGIESGSQEILNDMKKNLNLKLIKEKIDLINKIGIDVNGFFIVGYPGETRKTILKTIKFAKKLKIKRAHFSAFLPLPGTESTKKLKDNGKINKIDYSKLFYSDVPYSPDGMTRKELKQLQRRAFLEFYLRPRIIWYMILEIKTFDHLLSLLKRARDYAFGR